jgi:hypothetical protein
MRGMRPTLVLVFSLVFCVFVSATARRAHADTKKDIEVKIKEAMESYDLFEYEEARKLLNTALTLAKKNKLESAPIVAKVHLSLGIVYYAGLKDEPSAKLAFMSAVEIDPKIQIDAAYRSAEMAKLLEESRTEQAGIGVEPGGGSTGGGTPEPGGVDCATVTGLQHDILDSGKQGARLPIEAYLGGDVSGATKVVIMVRLKGQEKFSEIPMTKQGDCKYVGAIPAKTMKGDLLHYYVAAVGENGRDVANKGSEGSPNIIELAASTGGVSDSNDNPLDGSGKRDDGKNDDNSGVTGGVVAGGKRSTVYFAVAVGTGLGYVSGKTEQQQNEVECCIAPGYFHFAPELGYYINKQLAIALAGRIGVPFGANIDGHAKVGPAGLLRVRYALSPSGVGVHVSGAIGGGIIRNTIKLTDPDPPGMDTDIVALGPMLLGGGAGYTAALGKSLRFNAELNATAGIPVVKTIGESHLYFGVQFDLALGLSFGF